MELVRENQKDDFARNALCMRKVMSIMKCLVKGYLTILQVATLNFCALRLDKAFRKGTTVSADAFNHKNA